MYEAQVATKTDPKPNNPLGLDITTCISYGVSYLFLPWHVYKVGGHKMWVGGR